MSPQHGSASSAASIFSILTITISNHCYAPTKASNTSCKKIPSWGFHHTLYKSPIGM
jgi:hypothetical protein